MTAVKIGDTYLCPHTYALLFSIAIKGLRLSWKSGEAEL